MWSKLLVLSALVGLAAAGCPDGCSGHGACGAAEMCTCEAGYAGLNCAKRECPYGLAWASAADEGVVPGGRGLGGTHPYTECSSVGSCDYTTGVCDCFDGYSGRGCRTKACPNDCSGHGKCMSNFETSANFTAIGGASFNTLFRDFLATRQCKCDRGFKGSDCSKRICPSGDDPITDCVTDAAGAAHEMIQRLYVRTLTPNAGAAGTGETLGDTGSSANNCQEQCGPTAATCNGYFECDHRNGHSYCSEKTKWYANEAFCQESGATGESALSSAATVMNACVAKLGDASGGTDDTDHAGFYSIMGGYIALKYTDMFGGVYKTRPILISNMCSQAQFIDIFDTLQGGANVGFEGAHTFYMPQDLDMRALQYGNSMAARTEGGVSYPAGTPSLLSEGAALAGTGDDHQHADFTGQYESKKASTVGTAASNEAAAGGGDILAKVHAKIPTAVGTDYYDQVRYGRYRYTADRIRAALEDLPNFAIPSINVTNYYIDRSDAKVMFTNVFDITFTSIYTAGRQPLLECIYEQENACEGAFPRLANSGQLDDSTAGVQCAPSTGNRMKTDETDTDEEGSCNEKYMNEWGSLNTYSCTVEEVHPGTKVYEENAECSNRGICDDSTGICDCYDGHSGEACQLQTVFF